MWITKSKRRQQLNWYYA